MINTVIKRNGRKVKFQPDKLNKLADWATDHNVSWSDIALNALKKLTDGCSVQDILDALIKACLDEETEDHLKVAGKLYVANLYKTVFAYTGSDKPPHLRDHIKYLQDLGYYKDFNYTPTEIEELNNCLKHDNDFKLSYTQIKQFQSKYFVKDNALGICYETPQFTMARITLAVNENRTEDRMYHVKELLLQLQSTDLSLPSPNWSFIGTVKKTSTSCCLFSAEDTSDSISANNHIVDVMTVASAGLGQNLRIRSKHDKAKKGTIEHMGKQGYHRAAQALTKSNKQGSRGGALTTYFTILDPECEVLIKARNPSTVSDSKVDEIDYCIIFNKFFAEKVIKNESWMLISLYVAPDLEEAFYSKNPEDFKTLYEKYDADNTVKKTYIKARDLAELFLSEEYETGRFYDANTSEMSSHTSFKDLLTSSNLCLEIILPHKPFHSVRELYEERSSEYLYMTLDGKEEIVFKDPEEYLSDITQAKDLRVGDKINGQTITKILTKNEIALCNIAAINLHRDFTDKEYQKTCYYALSVIDYVILNSDYVFPNLEYTAKKRMSAGVGLMNFAYELARNSLYYTSSKGKEHAHFIAERHAFFLHKASLEISKERGVAPWMHKTKYPEGWLPIDSYNKNVDAVVNSTLHYPWEDLRTEILDNGGIGHSSLVAHMPRRSIFSGS